MKIEKKDLPKKQIELTVELSIDELKPFLENTAKNISKTKEIKGFRKGKAPFDIVVKEVGEMALYQMAANQAIEATYGKAIEQENLNVLDDPKVEVIKLAPNNPFVYKVTVPIFPTITLPELDKIQVDKIPEIKVEKKEVEKVLTDLQKMRKKEVLTDKKAENGDIVEISFEGFMEKVPIEGGKADKHKLTIGEGQMIPGFEENIVGLKKDEEKEFEITFPEKYHAKNLAGKKAVFKIKVLAVYKAELPELNDEFAKGLGLEKLENLKTTLENNLKQEKENKAKQEQEIKIIEALIDKTKFDEIPESLINNEVHRMVHELQDNLTKQGMKYEDYLSHMQKKEADLMLDFTPDAIKRVKTGLIVREFGLANNVKATEKEVEAEIEKNIASYKLNPMYASQLPDIEKKLNSPESKQYFETVIVNRKTIELIKEKVIKK